MEAYKILVHQAAAQLTAAVLDNLEDKLPVDPTIADKTLQGANLMAWETHRIFYHAIVGALKSTDWPAPPSDDLNTVLAPILSGQGVGAILKPLLEKLLGAAISVVPGGSAPVLK